MKRKDRMIDELLETIETIAETVEDYTAIESDFLVLQPIIDALREEIIALSEVE